MPHPIFPRGDRHHPYPAGAGPRRSQILTCWLPPGYHLARDNVSRAGDRAKEMHLSSIQPRPDRALSSYVRESRALALRSIPSLASVLSAALIGCFALYVRTCHRLLRKAWQNTCIIIRHRCLYSADIRTSALISLQCLSQPASLLILSLTRSYTHAR